MKAPISLSSQYAYICILSKHTRFAAELWPVSCTMLSFINFTKISGITHFWGGSYGLFVTNLWLCLLKTNNNNIIPFLQTQPEPQSRQSAKPFLQSCELGLPHSLKRRNAGECVLCTPHPPLVWGGGGGLHSLRGEGVGDPTRGQTLWYSNLYMCLYLNNFSKAKNYDNLILSIVCREFDGCFV
jgi:hypothetical protein